MIFTETKLNNACIIELETLNDDRGFFARAWCKKELEERGLSGKVMQANVAYNKYKGILRGLHRQVAPYEEVKIVRCTRGTIYDVIVDLRKESSSYKQWIGIELSASNRKSLYVPEGFAHGYLTLEDNCEVFYQVSQYYSGAHERGARWDDKAFAIEWPKLDVDLIISDKDKSWPDFEESQ